MKGVRDRQGTQTEGFDESASADGATAIEVQSRTLRNSIVSLAVFFAIEAALLLAVPDLRSALDELGHADPALIGAAVVLELLSCVGYAVLFGLVFEMLDRRLTSRLSMSELAVNSVVSVSGLAGIALGAWVLRSKGVSVDRIARRSVLIFVLTSAVNVGAVVAIGVPMWLGLLPGSQRAVLTLLPAAVALGLILGTLALAGWARGAAARQTGTRRAVALKAIGDGVADALVLIRAYDWRLLGAVAYWLLDNVALYACLGAFGEAPSFWVVAMAYLVGMLANSIPIPGGMLAVEGSLVGMLLLFGVRPASHVVVAVVIYRAISLWIPAVIGSLAFLSLRREIGKPLASGASSG
ncbi:MAG TPA: lysylphosphatidylglycerol synthase transmembrane domain-containing protein [Solirubrobacteraceae bacterium]|nr:lysylphosphatidylglycerol synthase transmembrane domain-containing protein [Solirubrobacteraceae bacterium]